MLKVLGLTICSTKYMNQTYPLDLLFSDHVGLLRKPLMLGASTNTLLARGTYARVVAQRTDTSYEGDNVYKYGRAGARA